MHTLSPISSFFINLGILLLAIEIIVFVHELGHFLIAKYNKVRVSEFAIGMGPSIFSWRKNGTTFSIRIFPVGGYVAALSKHTLKEIDRIKKQELTPEQREYITKKLHGLTIDEDYSWQKPVEDISWVNRAWFASMGVIFNFIFAYLLLLIIYPLVGKTVPTENAILLFEQQPIRLNKMIFTQFNETTSDFKKVSFTADYDLMRNLLKDPEDILKYYEDPGYSFFKEFQDPNGTKYLRTYLVELVWEVYINNQWEEISTLSNYFSPDAHVINIGQNTSVKFNPNSWFLVVPSVVNGKIKLGVPILPNNTIGIDYRYFHKEVTLEKQTGINGFGLSTIDTFKEFSDGWIFIADIFSFGSLNKALDVPLTIISDINIWYWLYTIIDMIILVSMIMIAFNVLPIPPLDGFKICEAFYVGIKKKEISYETQAKLSKIGWIFILTFTFIAIFAFSFV